MVLLLCAPLLAQKPNLSDSTPSAPSGRTNVQWQKDTNGNISASVPAAPTQADVDAKADASTVNAALEIKADANTVNAHTSATQAHGSNGAVVGTNDLASGLATKADSATVSTALAGKQNLDANCKPDGNGNLICKNVQADNVAVGTSVSSPEYCISDSCITSWSAGLGGGTVTNTGTLTSGKLLIGNGGIDLKTAECFVDEAGVLNCPGFKSSATGPAEISGAPGTCSLSTAGEGKLCLSSATNRFRYSYNGGAYTDLLQAGDSTPGIAPCSVGLYNGGSAITAGTYSIPARCRNVYGATYTITSVKCYSDNSGTSTANVADSDANALLTGAVTASPTWASGTQSATTTIAANKWTSWTLVADGTSTVIQCVMTTSH